MGVGRRLEDELVSHQERATNSASKIHGEMAIAIAANWSDLGARRLRCDWTMGVNIPPTLPLTIAEKRSRSAKPVHVLLVFSSGCKKAAEPRRIKNTITMTKVAKIHKLQKTVSDSIAWGSLGG